MSKTWILTSVSVAALMTAAGASGVRADNVVFDLTVAPPTLTAAADSASVIGSDQFGSVTNITALNSTTLFGSPTKGVDDYKGGTGNNLVVDKNKGTADAYSNDVLNSVNLFAADGKATLDAATIGVLQVTVGADISSIDATVTGADVRISVTDLGTGSTASLTNNGYAATTAGNRSVSTIAGDINPGLNGNEIGQSTATPAGMDSDATALVSTMQLLVDVDSPTANVTSSHMGLQAVSDGVDTTALAGVPLTVTGNSMTASITGNDATGAIVVDDDKAIAFPGSIGVASFQYAEGDDSLTANTTASRIEIGAFGVAPTADMVGGSATFSANEMRADATANAAANSIDVPTGITLNGIAVAADQANIANGVTDTSTVGADLFIQNTQTSVIGTASFVSDGSGGTMSVFVQDLSGSSVLAGDGDLTNKTDKGDFGNTFAAISTGSDADNLIEVKGATTFAAVAAINSTQVTAAANAATMGGVSLNVSAATLGSAGTVTKSAINTDGNVFATDARGNTQSSELSIVGTDITGAGVLPTGGAPSIELDRSSPNDEIQADFSLLNAQVLDGNNVGGLASASASTNAGIAVDVVDQAGAGGTSISASQISVTANNFSGAAMGNLSTENSIVIDAGATFSGTVGVINDQTVMNLALLSSVLSPSGGAYINVDVAPQSLTDSTISVDDNTLTSRTWGNLADATTNSFSVDGVTVTDGDTASKLLPTVSVDRSSDTVPISAVNGGFALLNDQSVEDLEGATASAGLNGPLIAVDVGSANTKTFDNTDVLVDGNAGLVSVTLNQATSKGTVNATDLDASSSLVNVQSFVDEDNDGNAGAISVSAGGATMLASVDTSNSNISDSDLSLSDNSLTGVARINLATNSLKVTAQTQTITGVAAAGAQQSVELGADTATRGETTLVNDQYFDDLKGVSVSLGGTSVILDIDTGTGDLVNVNGDVDGNSALALAAGNDATNTITLDVGSFDLTDADSSVGTNALNGPVATLASNQRSIDVPDAGTGFSTSLGGLSVKLDASGVTGDITGTDLSVDGNSHTSWAQVNNVSNTLNATGTAFITPTTSTPLASVLDATGGDDIVLTQTGFVVASRQENAYNASSSIGGSSISVIAEGAATIVNSTLSADGNLVDAQAHGNDSINSLKLDFGTNEAQGFVINAQSSTTADPSISASPGGNFITLDANGGGTTVATASAFSVSGNTMEAVASANRTKNSLTSLGTNIIGGSGAAPSVVVNPAATGDLKVTADLAIVNAQGSETIAGTEADKVSATLNWGMSGTVDTIDTGSLTVDNNLAQAQAIIHGATNTLVIDADANVTGVGASVTSQQVVTAGSSVSALSQGNSLGASVDDVDAVGSAAISVSKNDVVASGIGGSATNVLSVTSDASITGTVAAPAPTVGTATTLNADFVVMNSQLGDAATITTGVDGTSITGVVTAGNGLSGDALSVDNNLIQARSVGFSSGNLLSLDAGASSDATGIVSNRQLIDGTAITATAAGVHIEANTLDALNSSVTTSDNDIVSVALANTAYNGLVTSADATLQETSGAGLTIDPAAANVIAVTGSEYSVLNWQTTTTGTLVSSSVGGGVTLGVDELDGVNGVDNSTIDVSGNEVLAQSVANNATNELVLNTGTFQHPSAAVGNLQTNTGTTVTATVTGVQLGIGVGGGTINANSNNSSLSVTGNSIGATAIGNSAVNRISAD